MAQAPPTPLPTAKPGESQSLPLEVALMELVCRPPACSHVIQLLDWFEEPEYVILVLELPSPCLDVSKFTKQLGGYMEESLAQVIMRQVVQAALHCRERGVLHRDIKSKNLLIQTDDFHVKLIDFGCGDLLKEDPYRQFAGSLFYNCKGTFSVVLLAVVDVGSYGRTSTGGALANSTFGQALRDGTLGLPQDALLPGPRAPPGCPYHRLETEKLLVYRARERGVLHRDIKSSKNLLILTDDFHVKLSDFGCGDLLKEAAYRQCAEWVKDGEYYGSSRDHVVRRGTANLICWCLQRDPSKRPVLEKILQHDCMSLIEVVEA
ncbi:glycogen synthase kinase 1-like [Megalops cyprinoides]|uniref:glycogen synthase kinase 1-like n=1 Tax=Megalops cyprinoides TaxID=118141 RepID=UPI0018655EEF|nr:glycogen synthase kinase 1-like [Megalops cyprinoides]